ncbi:MAG: HAMP domain-containing histidine kinase [Alphaproteobacteria bacterium]|nr:HAMP domain-containing histidine kinase [Alphaproteobacteria bacterium]MBU2040904.1 HAMP domain-containing histidine kinase [Alphaproteobacteria bacterium]MBU2124927.1 HAMP domain-containing histidine kinase [Alphaproteobacteria bacterium]MBU2207626.1 HAMP domain-containing histidine kinase [Alphaproteobacteria bacterium]MBU2289859.1 HAMP domain-containing histidine kinase [Alphaproteobacteria bacterium]
MIQSARPDPKPLPDAPASDRPSLAAWHAGWAVSAALLALGGRWIGGVDGPLFYGVLAMVVPGLSGLALLRRDGSDERMALLAIWGLAALLAAALSGGLTGPLSGFVFLPLAAGIALGGPRPVQAGAFAVGLAALAGMLSAWVNPGPHLPTLAAISALLTAAAAALAVRLSWRQREGRLTAAEAETARVETLLAAQPGLTLVLEPSGRVLAAYGAPPVSLPVDPLFESGLVAAVHAPDRPRLLDAIERAMRGQDGAALFAPRMALDRRVQLIVRRLDDPSGPRLIAQVFDATAQYARELGLEIARAEAETREAGKTRFLANMSHELRTPLNAVLGFSDIMRQRIFGPLPDRYGEYAENIHQAGGHLLDLINDVLDVTKIEAERYALTLERFDAREVVSAAMALVRVNADDKGVSLSSVLPGDPVEVSADKRALKQIALNLLSNAVKFTPRGGSITVTVEAIGPYLEVVVADTGVGIAPEDVRRLGRPFEQAGEMEQRRQGTGLGLSLVRAFAELHGGRMSIDSTLGEGTAVTVRLPVALIARAPAPEGGAEIIQMPLKSGG